MFFGIASVSTYLADLNLQTQFSVLFVAKEVDIFLTKYFYTTYIVLYVSNKLNMYYINLYYRLFKTCTRETLIYLYIAISLTDSNLLLHNSMLPIFKKLGSRCEKVNYNMIQYASLFMIFY